MAVMTLDPKMVFALKRARELCDAGELDDAYKLIEDYLAENPNDPQALVCAAVILRKANKTPIALSLARRAADMQPDRPEPWAAMGLCQQQLWFSDEALRSYQKAVERSTNDYQKSLYLNDIGSTLLDQGKFEEAEPYLRQSLELDDSDPMVNHNLGLSLLAQKRWEEGWENYAYSMGSERRLEWKYRDPPEPTWDGTKGQKVIIFGEQGLGDEICFASMVPDVCKDADVIIDCDHRLEGLFKRSFPDAVVHGTRHVNQLAWPEKDRDFDASIAFAELGKLYRKEDEDFDGSFFLKPCPIRTQMWKSYFASLDKPVIGIAWSGGVWQSGSKLRFAELDLWKQLFESVDAHWVCLEYRDAASAIEGTPVVQYPWATLTKDYDDTVAMIAAMDCVVSVPTAVVHAAGAVGTPVVMMKAATQCWKTYAGIPFHPVTSMIEWQGDWDKSIQAAIPEVQKCLEYEWRREAQAR